MKRNHWFNTPGDDTDVAVSSRIRFARNFNCYPFCDRLEETGAREIVQKTENALGSDFSYIDFSNMDPAEGRSYMERHLVSPAFLDNRLPHALALSQDGSCSVMINEEDHIRMQCILPGMALTEAYRRLCTVDDVLCAKLPIAYDENLGFLTQCPTNLGSGMRASVMLFLPALQMTSRLPSIAAQLSKLGVTIRGLYGEGSEAQGALYQISNQVTLGVPEEEIIAKLEEVIRQIIALERKARGELQSDNTDALRDRIMRAWGTMHYACMMSSSEFMKLYADVRLGVSLGYIKEITYEKLGELMISVMPGSLTVDAGHPMEETERDVRRADTVRAAVTQ